MRGRCGALACVLLLSASRVVGQALHPAVGECEKPLWSTSAEALAAASALTAAGMLVDSTAVDVIRLPIDENDLGLVRVRLDATREVAELGRVLELRALVAWAATVLFAVDTATVRRVSNRAVDAGLLDLPPGDVYSWFVVTAHGCIADPP